ncbi:anthranilate synthase component I family protein [Mycetocola sp.]|uniref:anthranilate synthase component I family protein n=1 Tax=Mycetocola sp. TaxID=1871042 RepID=UPI0026259539|nr:anthranilate synthase component I family protein [Mycetocola sp.]MCU1561244.1 aminodeoxychorismate synthase component [Mycetocola sp.]
MESSLRSRQLSRWIDPESAFLTAFGSSARAFWLDSGIDASEGFSYLGDGTELLTAAVADHSVTRSAKTDDAAPTITANVTIFDALRAELSEGSTGTACDVSAPAGEFSPGWVGWIGYEAGADSRGTPAHPSRYPDAAFLRPARMLIFDHTTRTITALEVVGPATEEHFGWLAGLSDPTPAQPPLAAEPRSARWRHPAPAYGRLIAEAQEEIRRGNAYQLCLTNEALVDGDFDPVEVYRRLRHASPSHHGGLLVVDGTALVSSSPEQFLRVTPDGTVTTRPIKATRPRGSTPDHEAKLAAELVGSDKERAENLMIVDLMRNDLGRVAVTGSVAVTQLLAVESYAQVHQLVSTVTARLADGVSGVDAVESAFPAGSMTGAPKISAMTILDRLESGPRGVYSGAFGYVGADGAIDLAMVIRSILIDSAGASIGTGGGITALSVIEEEIEETQVKAAALLAALGASEQEVG